MTVYFIQGIETGHVKIGHSSKLEERIRRLQASSPDVFHLVALMHGGIELEKRLHSVFGENRRNGEWFAVDKRMSDAVDHWIKTGQAFGPGFLRGSDPKSRTLDALKSQAKQEAQKLQRVLLDDMCVMFSDDAMSKMTVHSLLRFDRHTYLPVTDVWEEHLRLWMKRQSWQGLTRRDVPGWIGRMLEIMGRRDCSLWEAYTLEPNPVCPPVIELRERTGNPVFMRTSDANWDDLVACRDLHEERLAEMNRDDANWQSFIRQLRPFMESNSEMTVMEALQLADSMSEKQIRDLLYAQAEQIANEFDKDRGFNPQDDQPVTSNNYLITDNQTRVPLQDANIEHLRDWLAFREKTCRDADAFKQDKDWYARVLSLMKAHDLTVYEAAKHLEVVA